MSSNRQLLIETDILADYLVARRGETTLLRKALAQSVCYTTMLNVMELFRAAVTQREREAVLQMLYVVRVLGFSARYAQPFADLALDIQTTSGLRLTDREAMVLGMAQASKLTILTRLYYERYRTIQANVINEISVVANGGELTRPSDRRVSPNLDMQRAAVEIDKTEIVK